MYFKYKHELESKFSAHINAALKASRWAIIADEVSAHGPPRTPDQCRKKVADTKSVSKSIAAKLSNSVHKTGGGPPIQEELTPFQALMVAKMPKVSYQGIPGYILFLFQFLPKKHPVVQFFMYIFVTIQLVNTFSEKNLILENCLLL